MEHDCFQYNDYREFLRNRYETLRKTRPQFSARAFAKKAAISSPSYLGLVISGKRQLLLASGLWRWEQDQIKTVAPTLLTGDATVPALEKTHLSLMDAMRQSLTEQTGEQRILGGRTFLCHKSRLPEIQQRIEQFKQELEALFDPDVVKSKEMVFTLTPRVVRNSCLVDPNGMIKSFQVKRDFILQYDDNRYAGAFIHKNAQLPWIDIWGDFQMNFRQGTMAAVYHAVVADLAQKMEFDSYEAPSSDPYISIIDVGADSLPLITEQSILYGIAGKGGHLFQMFVDNYKVELMDP